MNKENASEQGRDIFGNLLGSIEKLAKFAEDFQKNGENISKEGEIDLSNLKDGLKANYSFTVKTAADGTSDGTPFRSRTRTAKKEEAGANLPREVDLDVDVFEEGDAIKIFAQLSGVIEQDISIALNGDILELDAKNVRQRFRKEILLTKKVNGEVHRTFKNGVLEITLPLAL